MVPWLAQQLFSAEKSITKDVPIMQCPCTDEHLTCKMTNNLDNVVYTIF